MTFPRFAPNLDYALFVALVGALVAGQLIWLRRTRRLQHLHPIVWPLLGVILVVGWGLVESATRTVTESVRQKYISLLPTYVEELQRLGHEKLTLNTPADDPVYLQMIEREINWLRLNPFVADIYTLRRRSDGQVALMVDSETDYDHDGKYSGAREMRTPIGEIFDKAGPEMALAFAGTRAFTAEPYTDRWGTWISIFEPLPDSHGKIDAVLGLDFDAAEWLETIARTRQRWINLVGAFTLLLLGGATIVAVLQADLAARRMVERQLREQTTLRRQIFEQAPGGSILCHLDGRFHEVNAAFCKMTGYTAEELRGRALVDLTHPEDVAITQGLFADITRGRATNGSIEKRYLHKNGRTVVVLVNSGLVRDAAGAPLYYAGQYSDITEQRRERLEHAQLERQLLDAQKYESLGLLAGGLAHDFNNLLTTILGNASLARLKLPPDSPARTSLGSIEQATETAAALCRQLQAYSGGGAMATKPLDLPSTVQATAELLRVSVGANARLEISASPPLPTIVADPSQLRQVVMNLVLNASDALGARPGTIRLTPRLETFSSAWFATAHTGRDLPPGEYVCLEVADDGPGMDAALQARIFDPYFSTKGQGRGLGLAAVLGIMRGLGGAVHLRSAPGKGTLFTLVFLSATASYSSNTAPPIPIGWRGSGLVLVVDDDNHVRPVIAAITARFGFTVLQAASGGEAIALCREHGTAIKLALLDITMPVMDGFETLVELRKLQPELNAIFISGYTELDARNRFPDLHKMSFLPKPCTLNSLGTALRAVLG